MKVQTTAITTAGITTTPKLGIGQHAWLIETAGGRVLWDLVGYVDETTIAELLLVPGCPAALDKLHCAVMTNQHERGGARAVAVRTNHGRRQHLLALGTDTGVGQFGLVGNPVIRER